MVSKMAEYVYNFSKGIKTNFGSIEINCRAFYVTRGSNEPIKELVEIARVTFSEYENDYDLLDDYQEMVELFINVGYKKRYENRDNNLYVEFSKRTQV